MKNLYQSWMDKIDFLQQIWSLPPNYKVFFTQTEEVITRDGEKYVMEVEQFDNTFVRFYPYKNLFFSGLISIEESYPEATIIYYDKNGREISDHLSTSENQEELWYLNNRMT